MVDLSVLGDASITRSVTRSSTFPMQTTDEHSLIDTPPHAHYGESVTVTKFIAGYVGKYKTVTDRFSLNYSKTPQNRKTPTKLCG